VKPIQYSSSGELAAINRFREFNSPIADDRHPSGPEPAISSADRSVFVTRIVFMMSAHSATHFFRRAPYIRERGEGLDHRILDDVLAIDRRAGHARAVSMELGTELAQQSFEFGTPIIGHLMSCPSR
jgi:hypothetical protein